MADQTPRTQTTGNKPAENTAKKTISKKKTRQRSVAVAVEVPPVNLNVLFPRLGSEAAQNQTANKEASDIVKAIYHDINAHCNYERIANSGDSLSQGTFDNLVAATAQFVAHEISSWGNCVEFFKSEHGEFQFVAPDSRFFDFINALGWKMFAICAHAEAFRRWFEPANDRVWGMVCQKIQENFLSIEVYAHSWELKWRDILLAHQQSSIPGLPDMKSVIQTYMDWKVDHPHHTVITLDGKLKEPIWNGHLQEHINDYIFDYSKWNGQSDPTRRHQTSDPILSVGSICFLCGSPHQCDCQLQSRAGELVELMEFPARGTGVRALTAFRRDDVLGVFVGELIPSIEEDWIYPLTQASDCPFAPNRGICTIAPHRFGNWTRFVNHSCQPGTVFRTRTLGKRVVTTVEAVRDIQAFEELTVDYGEAYWSGSDRQCLCGEEGCYSLGNKSS